MVKHIGEQEILKLLKKLDRDSESVGEERTTTSISYEDKFEDGYTFEDGHTCEDGYIKVEQGKIIVANPSNGGEIPTVIAQLPVRLFVDGTEIKEAAQVSSESVIEWDIVEDPLFEVMISADKLEAYLIVHRKQRCSWLLTEQELSRNITITAEEDPTIILETINLQDILSVIDNTNIKMKIEIASIQAEIMRPTYQAVTIARGRAPVQGQDARLEMYFSENIENVFLEVRGNVDYKNHMHIPSVKNGDMIAKKTQPLEGQAGYDVFGNVLLPNPIHDIRIAGKDTVEITTDFVVIARKQGRPRVTGNKIKYFDINTAYIVPGNVDLHTGNIVFTGDVVVYGDVMDNMIIESLGNIYVSGSVFNSTLTATGSIAVRGNVIGSNLYSGYFGILYNRLYNSTRQLMDIIESMIESIELLMSEINKKKMQVGYGQALLLIIENKYPQVWGIVDELLGLIVTIQSHHKDALIQLKDYLEVFLYPTKIVEVMTAPRMKNFYHVLKEASLSVALSQESDVQININQAQNSTLKSNGDILIRREGVIQSDLYSTGNIIFFLDDSICRGSTLEAGDMISAMVVGGITGVGTTLKAKKKVVVKKMFGGRIIIDRYSRDIFQPIEEMTFDLTNIRQTE